nr:TPA_asm: P [Sesamum betacytorhabdovirus 1_Ses]DBA36795.1 TPA_asm: P [Sesamum betacytorhabdovirus 1_Cat]
MASDLESEDFFDEASLPKVDFKGPDLAHHLDTAIGGDQDDENERGAPVSLEPVDEDFSEEYEEEDINQKVDTTTKINGETPSEWSQISDPVTLEPVQKINAQEEEKAQKEGIKQLKIDLSQVCKEEGVLLIPSWENYFISQFLRFGEVSKWEMIAWVKGIKHERATSTISELKEIVSQLTIQVSRLTGQVKSLTDHQEALKESDKVIYGHLEVVTKILDEIKETNTRSPDKSSDTAQKITRKSIPKAGEILVIPTTNADSQVYTPHIKTYLVTEFLKLLGVPEHQLNNELLRSVTINLFPMDKIRKAVENGLKESDKERIKTMIRDAAKKPDHMSSSSQK